MLSKKINQYLASPEVRALAENTQDSYRYALLSRFNHYVTHTSTWHPKFIADSEAIRFFCEHLERLGVSGSTIQQYLTIVKLFLKWHGTPATYTYRIKSEERKAAALKKMDRWFDELDMEKCLSYKHKNPRNELIVHLLAETGMRIKELSLMAMKDVDADGRIIRIEDSKTKPRVVFFSPKTRVKILEFFGVKEELFPRPDDKLFPDTDQVRKIVNKMLTVLDLKNGADGRGPHTFRHYLATQLFYDGNMRLEDIARLLGDTPDVIESQYIHPTPKMLRRRVDEAMGWGLHGWHNLHGLQFSHGGFHHQS